MKKRLGTMTFGIFLWATGAAYGQSGPAAPSDATRTNPAGIVYIGPNIAPLTPEQIARRMRAENFEQQARAAFGKQDYAKAETDVRQAIALWPEIGFSQWILAGSLNAQGKTQEALAQYGMLASQGYNPPQIWLPYALLLLKTGQWSLAVSAYDQTITTIGNADLLQRDNTFLPDVLELKRLKTDILLALAVSQVRTSDVGGRLLDDQAIAEAKEAVSLSPNSALANYYAGYCLARAGHTAEAKAAYQRAVQLGHGSLNAAVIKRLSEIN